MKERLKRSIIITLAMVMMVTLTMPTAASAATKKTLTVMMKNTKITKNKIGMEPKKTSRLTVKYGGKTVTAKATYKSSNKKVVSVAKGGKLTAKKNGTATITAKYKGLTKKLKVTVHAHQWKAHYATKTVKETVIKCNCGATFDVGSEKGLKEHYDHSLAHVLAGEDDGRWFETVEKEVKYIDYYHCDCGAKKAK